MKKIDIKITKATITGFTVTLKEDKPDVSATISLLTAGGKTITSYNVSTDAWNEVNKFILPPEMIFPILEISNKLEEIVTGHCKQQNKLLKARAVK